MNEVLPPSAESDARLAAILDDYVAALHAGSAPAREELLQKHPDLAEDLDACLASVGFIRKVGWHPSDRRPHAPREDRHAERDDYGASRVLGDYRLLREVGKGGMGVVYEAEQISLGRRVALKVLPFAAALDERQLQRFRNEALAAAQLNHPHIVPVYSVGCERGVHYYAMQFIDGHTLAALIGDLCVTVADKENGRQGDKETRRQGERETAEVSVSPCLRRSWSTAHGSREFHRTAARLGAEAAEALEQAHQVGVIHRDIKPANLLIDGRGKLFVTDFGLARFPREANLTRTGDLLGTLRYMSPEQALGQRGLIDQRTDVYALGATLYELVALQPLFDGQDRHELLRQIAWDEPAPPRRLRPSLPVELETIILKCVAKLPHERYTTAQELADDLRRFLDDVPIRARRPTLWDCARKWGRRHRALVVSVLATLFIAVIVLSASAVVLVRQGGELETRRRQARRAADEMYTAFAQQWWSQQPHMEVVQRDFLLKALGFYSEFARETGNAPETRLETARAWRRVGEIRHRLGHMSEAEAALAEAVAMNPGTGDRDWIEELAYAQNERGNLFRSAGRSSEALEAYTLARTHFDSLLQDDSGSRAYRTGQAGCSNNRALVLHALDRAKEAEPLLHEARDLWAALLKEQPDSASARHDLASVHNNIGVLLQMTARLTEARTAFEQAIALRDPLLAAYPNVPVFQQAQAASHSGLGMVLAAAGKFNEAEQAHRQALALRAQLAASFSQVPAYAQAEATSHCHLGILLGRTGRAAEAEVELHKGLVQRRKLAADHPAVPMYRQELADSHAHLGDLYLAAGQRQHAEAAHREALALRQRLASENPHVARYQQDRARVEQTLVELQTNVQPPPRSDP